MILRPSVVFGPEDDFFNRFAEMARFSPVLPLIGGGKTRFQPVYVGDVADAAVAILDRPQDAPFAPAGKTYELAGPRIYSFKELMELLLAEIGRKRLLLPVPWGVARLQAAVLGLLPQPPLTLDQLKLLQRDNVASGQLPGFAELGITPDGPRSDPPRLSRPLPRRRAFRPGLGRRSLLLQRINSGFCLPSDAPPAPVTCFCRESAGGRVSFPGDFHANVSCYTQNACQSNAEWERGLSLFPSPPERGRGSG